jgi:DNA-binding beta-propeller fold protein YncE
MASGGANGCVPTATFPQGPEAVSIDQTLHVALVTNFACNNVSVITLNPGGFMTSGGTVVPYGGIIGSVAVGHNPLGIAVIPRMGYAVVANSGETPNGTAMIIDYANQQTPDNPKLVTWKVTSGTATTTANTVAVGLSPVGVAIDQDRALALIANNGDNTLTSIDLTVLLPDDPSGGGGHTHGTPVATPVALTGSPTAIAVDPNRSVAVVTNLQNPNTTAVTAGIDVVSLATTPPIKTSTGSVSSLSASLTGIVYDPGDPNNTTSTTTGLFYATSTQSNSIYSFNPDTGSATTIQVGINPYSLGYNYQTGTLLTVNSTSNSSSVVDVLNFRTRQTLGITSMSQFAIDVDNFSNVAVIADQNNNRLVYLEMPK